MSTIRIIDGIAHIVKDKLSNYGINGTYLSEAERLCLDVQEYMTRTSNKEIKLEKFGSLPAEQYDEEFFDAFQMKKTHRGDYFALKPEAMNKLENLINGQSFDVRRAFFIVLAREKQSAPHKIDKSDRIK